jgi:hypothetical protein
MLTPKSAIVGPPVFFEIFRREMKLDRPEEALFWLQLGRYRLWFDLVRCEQGEEGAKSFDRILDIFSVQEMTGLMQQHPELLKKTLQRVLDFDAKYPADDDPVQICKFLSPKPPATANLWGAYRSSLRRKTAVSIKEMDEVPAMPAPATAPAADTPKKPDKAPDKTRSP